MALGVNLSVGLYCPSVLLLFVAISYKLHFSYVHEASVVMFEVS